MIYKQAGRKLYPDIIIFFLIQKDNEQNNCTYEQHWFRKWIFKRHRFKHAVHFRPIDYITITVLLFQCDPGEREQPYWPSKPYACGTVAVICIGATKWHNSLKVIVMCSVVTECIIHSNESKRERAMQETSCIWIFMVRLLNMRLSTVNYIR